MLRADVVAMDAMTNAAHSVAEVVCAARVLVMRVAVTAGAAAQIVAATKVIHRVLITVIPRAQLRQVRAVVVAVTAILLTATASTTIACQAASILSAP